MPEQRRIFKEHRNIKVGDLLESQYEFTLAIGSSRTLLCVESKKVSETEYRIYFVDIASPKTLHSAPVFRRLNKKWYSPVVRLLSAPEDNKNVDF